MAFGDAWPHGSCAAPSGDTICGWPLYANGVCGHSDRHNQFFDTVDEFLAYLDTVTYVIEPPLEDPDA